MVDDVRLAVLGNVPVEFIGGISLDSLGLRHRPRPRCGRDAPAASSTWWSGTGERARRPPCRARPTRPPSVPARLVDDFTPSPRRRRCPPPLPGVRGADRRCAAWWRRSRSWCSCERTIAVFGIGCYTAFSNNLDVEVLQALHGRAPSVATGVEAGPTRHRSSSRVQGDGDMVSEGLQEVLHAAARGENITCVMLNNGVFGETGGHMTATTVLGQRTKTSLEGRDPVAHGRPILLADLVARLDGAAYVARCAVNSAGNVARTKRVLAAGARDPGCRGAGFSLRRDPHHVPDRMVRRDPRGPCLSGRQFRLTVHIGGVLKDVHARPSPIAERAVALQHGRRLRRTDWMSESQRRATFAELCLERARIGVLLVRCCVLEPDIVGTFELFDEARLHEYDARRRKRSKPKCSRLRCEGRRWLRRCSDDRRRGELPRVPFCRWRVPCSMEKRVLRSSSLRRSIRAGTPRSPSDERTSQALEPSLCNRSRSGKRRVRK